MPFLPVKAYAGSDYLKVRPDLKQITDPFTGDRVILTPPIIPDLCLIHGFYADRLGNALILRASDAPLAAQAARRTVVSVEAVVDDLAEVKTAEMKILPWPFINRLVVAPGGARPTACPGFYDRDETAYRAYLAASKIGEAEAWFNQLLAKGEGR